MTLPARLQPAPAPGRRRRVAREVDLEWFFNDGQMIFEGSSFGAVLERQEHFGQRLAPCEACNGTGFTDTDGTCRPCKGFGGKPRRLTRRSARAGQLLLATKRCGACRGRTGLDCEACHGDGSVHVPGVGVRSRPYDETPSYTPNENDLTRYAQVSRWLMRVPPSAVRVLGSYYGLDGYRWGATKWTRMLAVLPHTPVGRAMLQKEGNKFGLTPRELLENVMERIDRIAETEQRINAKRRVALAVREASVVFAEACAAWNAAVLASTRRKARP